MPPTLPTLADPGAAFMFLDMLFIPLFMLLMPEVMLLPALLLI